MLSPACWQALGGRCWGSPFVPTTATELPCPSRSARELELPVALPGLEDGKGFIHPGRIWRCGGAVQGRQECTPETSWVPHPQLS